jgi:hypothetical protein
MGSGARAVRLAKRDTNHTAIVQALKDAGCTVLDLSAVGGGCPDILVGYRGRMFLLEIKYERTDKKGSDHPVTANQRKWHETWRGPTPVVVRSIDDALAVVFRRAA